MRKLDLSGKKFNRWTIIEPASIPNNKSKKTFWICICDCGTIRTVDGQSIKKGDTKSCGCHRNEVHSSLSVHGQSGNNKTSEYKIWQGMKTRCYNPKDEHYLDYGGRGILVCDRWLGINGFVNFFLDMGKRPSKKHSLDRFPNNETGNYDPSNCRWATRKQQSRNKRNNRWIPFNGKNMIISDWATFLKTDTSNIRYHLKNGKDFSWIFYHYKS